MSHNTDDGRVCSDAACGCGPLGRRDFLRLTGTAAVAVAGLPAVAGPFTPADFEKLVPADKKLDPRWIASLTARGEPAVYRGQDLEKIGMPVGGICAGQVYLGGDGKLWHWDIFNKHVATGAGHYANPMTPAAPFDQGFALRVAAGGQAQVRAMDRSGWREISFRGEYPIGRVEYRDADCPVAAELEAFSPFVPLNAEDSALPATVMRFTLRNLGQAPVEAELAGWLENAVCLYSSQTALGLRRNRVVRRPSFAMLHCAAEAAPAAPPAEKRPDISFDDFEQETYGNWTATGTAFGPGPVEKAKMPAYQGDVGSHGRRLVNSHNTRNGEDVGKGDAHLGTLASRAFVIERNYITFLIGGGSHKGKTCINLLVDDKPVLSATGASDNRMQPHSWDVRPWAGKSAQLQIVDQQAGPWGNIGIDDIVFSDAPRTPPVPLPEQHDFGTMGLVLLGAEASDRAATALPERHVPAGLFSASEAGGDAPAAKPFGQKLFGALGRRLTLKPGESAVVTFAVVWHFPNLKLGGLPDVGGRWYGKRFADATAVAAHLAERLPRLATETRLWRDTWYDSTLPYWLLDRTLLNTSILATSTCYWFGNGRFYGWEGVGCCPGTCTHVWHYAHAAARLFPSLERSLREMVDFGVAFEADTGRIRFRAEHNHHWAVDGQAGNILRAYREHLVSADDAFLRRVWPRLKKAVEFLIERDGNADGLLEGPQHNTLDADWHGQVAWLSGLYLAALRAGEEMARRCGDDKFAQRCRAIFEQGRRLVDQRLFNGEYYYQRAESVPPAAGGKPPKRVVGSYDGCEIDQVFGQSWAWQVGLGRILDAEQTKTALRSLWKYNFTPDVGPYRAANKPGRWYAMAGEGGLLMCSWPKGDATRVPEGFDYYFNECMTGFEYQVAWHMIAEGMVTEGLAVARTIHDRYHPARRNPFNEVECGDHYARAMASYGVFLAACGFEYDGPQGRLGFDPRIGPADFRAAFTAAEGWGTFAQQAAGGALKAQVALKWGRLRLKTLALTPPAGTSPARVAMTLAGKPLPAKLSLAAGRAEIALEAEVTLAAGEIIEVVLG